MGLVNSSITERSNPTERAHLRAERGIPGVLGPFSDELPDVPTSFRPQSRGVPPRSSQVRPEMNIGCQRGRSPVAARVEPWSL